MQLCYRALDILYESYSKNPNQTPTETYCSVLQTLLAEIDSSQLDPSQREAAVTWTNLMLPIVCEAALYFLPSLFPASQ
jgi:hypothetical protein